MIEREAHLQWRLDGLLHEIHEAVEGRAKDLAYEAHAIARELMGLRIVRETQDKPH